MGWIYVCVVKLCRRRECLFLCGKYRSQEVKIGRNSGKWGRQGESVLWGAIHSWRPEWTAGHGFNKFPYCHWTQVTIPRRIHTMCGTHAKQTDVSTTELNWFPGAGVHENGLGVENERLIAASILYNELVMQYHACNNLLGLRSYSPCKRSQ